eukprot:946989-Amphidinium_carterae.1
MQHKLHNAARRLHYAAQVAQCSTQIALCRSGTMQHKLHTKQIELTLPALQTISVPLAQSHANHHDREANASTIDPMRMMSCHANELSESTSGLQGCLSPSPREVAESITQHACNSVAKAHRQQHKYAIRS